MIDATHHHLAVGDARALPLPADSVDLVVTSPPYPMVEMWDDAFAAVSPAARAALEADEGWRAFDAMHDVLDDAWADLTRVLRPGGIVAIDVGDATRTVDGAFRQFPNRSRVDRALREAGLRPLPDVVWHKPTNSAAKFLGSGTRPPNAYVTLEHEHLLVARNGDARRPDPATRDASAYFWEERNRWFTDVWEVRGERQTLDGADRDRAGAFPFEVPYRLVNMFSVQGDVVLDPFLGTGTTTLAAAASARHSVGVDRDRSLVAAARDRVPALPELATARSRDRADAHRSFVADRRAAGDAPGYESRYGPVVTRGERGVELPTVESVEGVPGGFVAAHGVLPDADGEQS
ncbi:MAG: site-specific DNA-methyltransferase [Halobacteriaceae archaeon]